MTLPKYSEIENIKTISEIESEILILQKNLFDLRIKRATKQAAKPHLFKHIKRRIRHLQTKKQLLNFSN